MKAKRWPVAVALSMGLSGCTFDQMGACFDGGTSSSDANVILGLGCMAVVTTASLVTYGVVAIVEAGDDDAPDDSDADTEEAGERNGDYEAYWIDTCRAGMTGGAVEKARMGWLHAGYRPDGDEADAYLWFRLAQQDDPDNDDAESGLARVEPLLTEADRTRADAYAREWRLDPGRCDALYLGHRSRYAEPAAIEVDDIEADDTAAGDLRDESDAGTLSCYGWRRMYDCQI